MTADTRGRLTPFMFEHAGREHTFYATSSEGAAALFELWPRRPSVGGLTEPQRVSTVRASSQVGGHRDNGPALTPGGNPDAVSE